MTHEEKQQMTTMQKDITEIKTEIHSFKGKFDELYTALMGSTIGRDGGLVGRIGELETEVEILKKENFELKKDNTKRDLYLNIIWGLGGNILTTIGIFVINYILKK